MAGLPFCRGLGALAVLLQLLLLRPVSTHFEDEFDDEGGMGGMGMDGYDDMDGEGDYGDDEGGGGGGGGDLPHGALNLDSYTFDKVVGAEGWTTLVKFDKHDRWSRDTDTEEHYKTLCSQAYEANKFLIGEVQVEVNGDAESNDDLRKRFGLSADQFPAYLLFKDGSQSPLRHSGATTASALTVWLRGHGVKIPAMGTIAELDMIAMKVTKSGSATDADIAEVQRLGDSDFKGDRRVEVYVKILRSIQSKGINYVETESKRVEKVLAGQLSDEKRRQLSEKLNILSAFVVPPVAKDEL